ncbi:urocanate hydratase-like isoform X1 [Orbicella faveolata]|uniref:urocanate hydratase-like isoform X1 n=2 Tax=Orbicella faveolata TaxID=48498 RepID=UPI0009E4E68F|nr:urocanate hydratase-like isoform X1 [Orbicella faveolata]
MASLKELCDGLPIDPLPSPRNRDNSVPHAPVRTVNLSADERRLALQNALRYFPSTCHHTLAPEFAQELREYGHIYMYRFRPDIEMRAYPIDEYPARTRQAAAIMLMIMNNLDPRVAQFPHELVTYGGNGQVFSNWAQFWIVMQYLSEMTEDQTLVMCSGHPQGLFPSSPSAPRAVITNGMVIPNYSSKDQYDKMFALGVTMYGQMTAGSYCYIGPQGIVHGTTIVVLNAARRHLGVNDLRGKVFVTAGLGGMSGAQAKAAVIAGCIGVVAEVDEAALKKRHAQGWLMEYTSDVDICVELIKKARKLKKPHSLGYHGNVVDLWERLVQEYESTGEVLAELGSDQTSLHNPFNGGYYPVQVKFDEANEIMKHDPERFKALVQESLRRQVAAINKLTARGMFFWDYGNAFLLEASRAGADVCKEGAPLGIFRYPSYVQDIMGDIFSLGFGPFRWVCTSGLAADLATTDKIAKKVFEEIMAEGLPAEVKAQYEDNLKWIEEAQQHQLVVGSQARILYSDQRGRVALAQAFNKGISEGRLQGCVVISRDHHDVSGTDSPFRETSNIYDGSSFCADMAVQNAIGDSFRGATWVALHNGGGVGWGEVVNGGFGLVLDGSQEANDRARVMLSWDVNNGVARRCWSGNLHAKRAICTAMEQNPLLKVTIPSHVEDVTLLDNVLKP